MKDYNDAVTYDKVTLQKIQFGISEMISPALMEDMRYESIASFVSNSIIKQLKFYLWGNRVNSESHDEYVSVYPATMWEEIKRDFWPQWLKRRFPIRYSRDVKFTTHNHYHVCPHLNTKSDRPHLDFMMLNDVDMPTHKGER